MSVITERSGVRYGSLIAVKVVDKTRTGYIWECKCDCGQIKNVPGIYLSTGRTKSCGCLRSVSKTTHEMSGKGTYLSWCQMKARCLNPNNPSFKHYGARGITIDPDWMDFNKFLDDMGIRPDFYSIERKDVNGGYNKTNCEWIPKQRQSRNRRNVTKVGDETIQDIAQRMGVSVDNIRYRVKKGIPLNTPVIKPGDNFKK